MNVTAFGATGQIGRLVVGNLLTAGHDVTAYVRNLGKLGSRDSRLSTIVGELSDEARIQQAVRGSDAVISALGPLLNELVGMTTAVTRSDLDWTIARITRPTGGNPKGTVRAGFLGRDRVASAMSRADIATFLVAQLTDATFSRAAPAISN